MVLGTKTRTLVCQPKRLTITCSSLHTNICSCEHPFASQIYNSAGRIARSWSWATPPGVSRNFGEKFLPEPLTSESGYDIIVVGDIKALGEQKFDPPIIPQSFIIPYRSCAVKTFCENFYRKFLKFTCFIFLFVV